MYTSTMSRSHIRKKRKLSRSADCEDGPSTKIAFEDNDFICPVFFDTLKEVHVTVCGHSFCYKCITESLTLAPVCPMCKATLPLQNPIHPNVSLNDLVTKFTSKSQTNSTSEVGEESTQAAITAMDRLTPAQFESFCKTVEERKLRREEEEEHAKDSLLVTFLEENLEHKCKMLKELNDEVQHIKDDLAKVKNHMKKKPGFVTERQKLTMMSSFTDLVDSYHKTRLCSDISTDSEDSFEGLHEFGCDLHRFTKFSSVKELASLHYGDVSSTCSIVSSLEFDRDCEIFAVAGVTKRIKVFSLRDVLLNTGFQNHYPVQEMVSNAKFSSVHFNPYLKPILVTSDYEGAVIVWDVSEGSKVSTHLEHGKRVWSVMFNPTEPQLFASGSDDGTVKLWVNNRQHSIHTLDTKANVCCVRFHPTNRYYMAYGSADHSVHYVDLRNPGQQLHELKGHKKAVSYVQFMSENEIVSASTDSELKLWNANTGQFVRTFKGHVNEKNFVGLSACKNFISCGSENNCLYVYGKHVSKPMLNFKFKSPNNSLPESSSESSEEFVSAVCWKKDTGVLLGANSQGLIKVLEMV